MNDLVIEWIRKAEEDYSVVTGLLRRKRLPANVICFHCQQTAEKLLKALLQRKGIRFGRVHDLEALFRLLGKSGSWELLKDDMKLLSDYAVKYRYPGQDATSRQARDAGKATRRVRVAILTLLKEC